MSAVDAVRRAKLVEGMREEAKRLTDRAIHRAMCGENEAAEDMRRAANGLLVAVNMLDIVTAGEREAREGVA